MKYFSLLTLKTIIVFICFDICYGQSFNASGIPLSLGSGTTLNPTCGAISSSSITFNVSGVGVLSSTNQLLEIDMRLRTPGSIGRLAVSVFLRSPSGTCVQIATQMGDVPTSTGTNKNLDYKFRAPNACLNKYPDYQATNTPARNFEAGVDSRTGVFSTVGDISTAFNGENANGTWTMYFGRTNSTYNTLPSVQSAELTFGSPLPISAPNSTAGASCVGAINWDGTPLCATTAGKTDDSSIRPSASISGCNGWMSTGENNLWIAFTPDDPNVCINISGINYISGTESGVQSIIVESSNPCSSSANWNVVNCPRDNIYSSNVGSTMSHNHCFTATPGNTYYLVVDGNAGAVTEIYITGIQGMPVILSAELIAFEHTCNELESELNWITASESNNDYFIIEYSDNGKEWFEIGKVNGSGNKKVITEYSFNLSERIGKGYFRLKQVDFDGNETLLKTIVSSICINNNDIRVIPNPNKGVFYVVETDETTVESIYVYDILGNMVFHTNVLDEDGRTIVDLSNYSKGFYLVNVHNTNGKIVTNRVLIE